MYFDTAAEYDAEITAFRAGLRALATANSYSLSRGGTVTELRRESMDAYRSYLKELISERGQLNGSSTAAASRVYAVCGRGRG
jgi:hypothetical protein